MIPLARPRSDVGNSSGPYTRDGGHDHGAGDGGRRPTAPTSAIRRASTMATVSSVPAATPNAPTGRRPRCRPGVRRPRARSPPGVLVRMVKTVICHAAKPSSSRRNSLSSCDAGAVNRASRRADAASSQKREPCPAIPTSAWAASKRRLSGRCRAASRTSGQQRASTPPSPGATRARRGRRAGAPSGRARRRARRPRRRSENANAREPDGISSATTIADQHAARRGAARARASGRRRATRGRAPARTAPRSTQPAVATPSRTRRRPRRSARLVTTRAPSTPMRTSESDRALVGLAGVELVGREGDRLRQQRADEPEDQREVAERPERGAAATVGRLRR